MTRILVLYYSSYGHTATMARAVAEGAREAGAFVEIKRVPELVAEEIAKDAGYKVEPDVPVAEVADLISFDAIILGTPTRFGNMAAQLKNFLDQCGGLWFEDKLVGKIGSVFVSTGTQHGGQESTILATQIALMHLGMVMVGLPYSFKGQMGVDQVSGGTPYGASTISGDGQRQPDANELEGARFQGRHVAELAIAMQRGLQSRELETA